MTGEWEECELGKLAEIQTGPFGSQLHQEDYVPVGTPLITVKNLGDNKITYNKLDFVSDKDKERLSKFILQEEDIVFSRVGYVDRRAFITKKETGWLFSGSTLRVRVKDKSTLSSKYLSYYFGQKKFKDDVKNMSVGATRPSLNTQLLKEIRIIFPPLPEQRAIASVLSSLDDKIDLLHRQNKTLEAMAETLFRQWFVEEADEEWEESVLGDVISVKGGTTPSTKEPEYWDGDIYWTSPRDLSDHNSVFLFDTQRKITEKGLAKIGSGLLPIGTVLLSSRAPIGYLAITEISLAINQGYIAIVCDKVVSNYFIFLWCKANMENIKNAGNGSVFQEIAKSVFKELRITIPPSFLLDDFEQAVNPLFEKIKTNQQQIRTLEKLRDMLLPKLMSGEVRVEYG